MHTVSQVKHRVSLVRIPSNSLWTSVASREWVPEFELAAVITVGTLEDNVATEAATEGTV